MSVLVASGLGKQYGGVVALRRANITLNPGEVHGLVGENGAGKSTMVKILSGVLRPDTGRLVLDGQAVEFANVRQAAQQGVAMVSQELTTFDDLTVLENLFPLGVANRLGLLRRKEMERAAAPVLDELGLDVPFDERASSLTLADRQLVEICRALLLYPSVLILDEPTSALPAEAVTRLEGTVRRLVERGLAVLYISHYLEELLRIAKRITVLRDGRIALSAAPTTGVSLDSLVNAMLGDTEAPAPQAAGRTSTITPSGTPSGTSSGPAGGAVLSIDAVTVPRRLRSVSLRARGGEIVGVAGLQGAGHDAVLDLICGRLRPGSGVVRLPNGTSPRSLRQAVSAGVGYISGDRSGRGLMLDKPLWENVTSVAWLALGLGGRFERRGRFVARTVTLADRLAIRGDPWAPVAELSGGNQQKAVFAKWLDASPSVVVLDDPTRGVDVGARAEMHGMIRELAAESKIVVLASTDLAELAELCDRVLVFQRGRIVAELSGADLAEQPLSLAMNAGHTTPASG
jgi:ABC-type sugar transport system ATPase subunit